MQDLLEELPPPAPEDPAVEQKKPLLLPFRMTDEEREDPYGLKRKEDQGEGKAEEETEVLEGY